MNIARFGAIAAGTVVAGVGSYATSALVGADKAPSPGTISKAEVLGTTVAATAAAAVIGGTASLNRTFNTGNGDFMIGMLIGGTVGWAAAGVHGLINHMKQH